MNGRDDSKKKVAEQLRESVSVHEGLISLSEEILRVAQVWTEALRCGHTIYFCGNGGSAADAQHLAAELVGRYTRERGPLAAIALTTDTSVLTALANDYSFETVFARQVAGCCRPGDVVVGISTSGNSRNVLLALQEGKQRGAITVAFTGNGAQSKELADCVIAVPSSVTSRIQEAHITAGHVICGLVERWACGGKPVIWETRPAVFLDRDGTINRDVPYCSRPEDFRLLPQVGEGVRLLNAAGLPVVMVTNQSGIARGYFTEADLTRIHLRMAQLLRLYGARVDAIYYCPHLPDAGCPCRKPGTEMALRASAELALDLSASFVIGDSPADVGMGSRSGCRTVWLAHGELPAPHADHVAGDLRQAAEWVLSQLSVPTRVGI